MHVQKHRHAHFVCKLIHNLDSGKTSFPPPPLFQNLVVPYILAFKGGVPQHEHYAGSGDPIAANSICSSNMYPAYTNVISGFNSADRIQKLCEIGASKVLLIIIVANFYILNT